MYSPSSSGKPRRRGKDCGSTAAVWEGGARQQMIQQALAIGPNTLCFVMRLWDRAARHAYWDSLEVFQLARWYSRPRVERAARRLLNRGMQGELQTLRFVLEEELDLLTERRDAELAGQLLLPFRTRNPDEVGPTEQGGNRDGSAGFARTGPRESW